MPEQSTQRLKVVEGLSSLSPMVQPTYPTQALPLREHNTEHLDYHSQSATQNTYPMYPTTQQYHTEHLSYTHPTNDRAQNIYPKYSLPLTEYHAEHLSYTPYHSDTTTQNTYHTHTLPVIEHPTEHLSPPPPNPTPKWQSTPQNTYNCVSNTHPIDDYQTEHISYNQPF